MGVILSTVGDTLSIVKGVQYREGYHENHGGVQCCGVIVKDVQYRGGYHDTCGGYHEYRGVFSTMADIMMHVGGYHEYCGL